MKLTPKLGLVLMGAGLVSSGVGSGCSCEGEVSQTATSIEIQFPEDGREITSADDIDADPTNGIQIDVIVGTTGIVDGTTLVLTNSIDVDSSGNPVPTTGSVGGNQAQFAYTLPTTLPGDQVLLRVALEGVPAAEPCNGTRCAESRISVFENTCQFVTPRDQDELTMDQYPDPMNPFDPFEADVTVDCTGITQGENVALSVDNGLPVVVQVDMTGRAVFMQVVLREGSNVITVTPRTDAMGQNGLGNPVSATVTVNTGRCTASLIPDDGSVLLASLDTDTDPSSGMNAAVGVTTDCADTSTVRLLIQGPADTMFTEYFNGTPPTTPIMGGVRFLLPSLAIPSSVDPYDVVAVATVDEGMGGRSGTTIPTNWWVDAEPPEIRFVSVDDGACVGPMQDLDMMAAGIQLDIFGDSVGADDGSEIWAKVDTAMTPAASCMVDADCTMPLVCRAGTCQTVGTVTGNMFTIPSVTLPLGSLTVEYTANDRAGNQEVPPVIANVSAFDMPASAVITSPMAGVLGPSLDRDTATPGLQIDIQVTVSNVQTGTTGQLLIRGVGGTPDQPSVNFVPPSGAMATASIITTLEDGDRELIIRVEDPCGNMIDSPPLAVTVVSTPLQLTVNAYENANMGHQNRVLIPDGTETGETDIDLDIFTGTSSGDRTLRVRFFDAEGTDMMGNRICTGTENTGAEINDTILAAEEGRLIQPVSLPSEGVNCMLIEVTEGANSNTAILVITRDTMTPAMISFTDPPSSPVSWSGPFDQSMAVGFQRTLEVTLNPVDDSDGRMVLDLGGYNTVEVPVPAMASTATFTLIDLPEGSYTITAQYFDANGNGSSTATLVVTINLGRMMELALDFPKEGAHLTNANFQATVQLVSGATPTNCDLFVDGALRTSAPWMTPLDVNLSQGLRDIRVRCDDGGGTVGISNTVTITIDDVPPPNSPTFVDEQPSDPGQIIYANGNYVNALVPDQSAAPGLQHNVSLVVDTGGQDITGWTARIDATVPGLGNVSFTRPLTAGAMMNQGVAFFPSLDFGTALSGNIILRAVVTDLAGNDSTPITVVNLLLDRRPPVITWNSPDTMVSQYTAADDENGATPTVDLTFSFDVTGAIEQADCMTDPDDCLVLDFIPAPGMTVSPIRRSIPMGGGTIDYGQFAFPDAGYSAVITARDVAGNVTSMVHNFDVTAILPSIFRTTPPGMLTFLNAGFDGQWAFSATGFAIPTPLNLCSNVTPPGVMNPTPCRWGSDGSIGGPDAGVVVATGTLTGTIDTSGAFLLGVVLAEGPQIVHAEAREIDGFPDLASPFESVTVDTVRPTVDALGLGQNDTGNDGTGGLIRLNGLGLEGTANMGVLTTQVDVTVSGAGAGTPVIVRSNNPAMGTEVGRFTLPMTVMATEMVSFNIALPQGMHTLSVRTSDAAGNVNTTGPTVNVAVDVTAGTASVPGAPFPVLRIVHGALDDNMTPMNNNDDSLLLDITIPVTDNQNLNGSEVTLSRWNSVSGGMMIAGSDVTVPITTMGTSAMVDFLGYPLQPGLNFLEVVLLDAADTPSTPAPSRIVYAVDIHGPTLVLGVTDAVGVAQTCSTMGSCIADIGMPDMNNLVQLDRLDTDITTSGGTDLAFTLADCNNSHLSIENCAATPISVRVQSRIAGVGAFSPVSQGSFASSGDTNNTTRCDSAFDRGTEGCSLFDNVTPHAPGFAFAPGIEREIRLRATDINGNVSTSNVVFLQLNHTGAAIITERLSATMMPTGDILEDDRYFGLAENYATAPTFETNFRVRVTIVGLDTPVRVELSVNGGMADTCSAGMGCWDAGNLTADFAPVALPESSTAPYVVNDIDVVVVCNNGMGDFICGTRTYVDIVADTEAPLFQFDRCSLCSLGVPLDDQMECVDCVNANNGVAAANIDETTNATWNVAGDPNATPTPIVGDQHTASVTTYSIRMAPSLNVILTGADTDERVRLNGAMSGNDILPTAGVARFNNLEVANGLRTLIVDFSDRAGNAGVADPVRLGGMASEEITAVVDTIAPNAVDTTACIGIATTPTGGGLPRNDEDPSCMGACALSMSCSRLGGEATLLFDAPAEDNGSGGAVSSYEIKVAALEIPYGPMDDTISACDQLLALTPDEVDDGTAIVTVPATPAAPMTAETATVTGLFPHRVYCFGVVGVDDVGNRTDLSVTACSGATCHGERALPLFTEIPGTTSGPDQLELDPGSPNDNASAAAVRSGMVGGGFRMKVLQDMDGDNRSDIAVMRLGLAVQPEYQIELYMSCATSTTPCPMSCVSSGTGCPSGGDERVIPTYTIDSPVEDPWDFGSFPAFRSISTGDFDNDGRGDLAFCSFLQDTNATNAGAVFLYYGVDQTGIDTTAGGSNRVPSIRPDVALFGATANDQLCGSVLLADVDGRAGDDLIVATTSSLTAPRRVYGFYGGGRNRWRTTMTDCTASPPCEVTLDLNNPVSGWPLTDPPTDRTRPDFIIRGAGGYLQDFPRGLTAADVDGDGTKEVIVADSSAPHNGQSPQNSGEVYVYRGGTALNGSIAAPDAMTRPPQLMHILRYLSGNNTLFGIDLYGLPSPVVGDPAEWLAARVGQASANRVVIFKGSVGGMAMGDEGIYPEGAMAPKSIYCPTVTTRDCPTATETAASYATLSRTQWDGTEFAPVASTGSCLGVMGELDGMPGYDIVVGGGLTGPRPVFLYSYSAATNNFEKRAILQPAAGNWAFQCDGADNYLGTGSTPVQFVTTEFTFTMPPPVGAIHIYR